MEFSVRFRMVMKGDSGISKFGYVVAVSVEIDANRTLQIRAFGSQ